MDALHWWRQGDAVTQGTALLLLAMSVASWVVILWKARVMRRALADVARCTAAFWQAPSLDVAVQRLQSFDREALVLSMVVATKSIATRPDSAEQATLATSGSLSQQLTRVLRDALHGALGRLQWGQVLLATVGSTAPFVGLLGTVWGIYHALSAMAGAGQITIDRVAGPVGEALVMTAAGLAVAIPAVLAYNVFGRFIGRIEADLEGFARDLRELCRHRAPPRSCRHDGARGNMSFGRLERTPGPQPMSDINMTPLVDVMLVLVVIFILTAPLMASSIRLDLPRTEGATPGAAPQSITLVVDATGQAFLEDQPLSQAALAERLQRIGAARADTEVQLRADAAVPYGRVVEVMGAAHSAGLQRIGFVAEQPAAAR